MVTQLTLDGRKAGQAQALLVTQRTVSLRSLKEKARKILPESSPSRKLILRQPDTLPHHDAIMAIMLFDDLLCDELGVA